MNKFSKILIIILLFKNGLVLAQMPEIQVSAGGGKYYENAKFKTGEINKSFYFIRHGQTDLNKNGFVSGSIDVPLNKEGISQAKKAAKLLKDKGIKIIVSSPLIRTKQTAEIINKELNVSIVYVDELKEADWGVKAGEVINKPSKNKKLWVKGAAVPGGESLYLFQTRIHESIVEIINKYDEVLIVGHGAFFGNFVLLLNGEYEKGKNALPYYFSPINKTNSKELYKITPLM
jgi:broad specificity phosphatase PhoE